MITNNLSREEVFSVELSKSREVISKITSLILSVGDER